MTNEPYDLIGDIHGCHQSLTALLDIMRYKKSGNAYCHPERKVVFLGDFIDRGPGQREVINIVRPMIETGQAYSVMGNHEFNAISYYTVDPRTKCPLREHSEKNKGQHDSFLAAYEKSPSEYADVINWFRGLPLWLELPGLRVVHACWDRKYIETLGNNRLDKSTLIKANQEGTDEYYAIETLLKGKEIPLPDGRSFKDKDGNIRHHIRVRWWDNNAKTYQSTFMGPESARTHIPDDEIEADHLIEYGHDEVPVFMGHYWFEGIPKPLAKNIACLDYSVGKHGGSLTAYRWDGENRLDSSKFVSVKRQE